MDSTISQVPYVKKKSVGFKFHDKAKPFHRIIFNVSHLLKPADWVLTSPVSNQTRIGAYMSSGSMLVTNCL